jgi:hypothetical protein
MKHLEAKYNQIFNKSLGSIPIKYYPKLLLEIIYIKSIYFRII